ncbi:MULTISPECIES: septal ring lytic transglycosylase RlpA family protein [Flavobacterium]|uniref:Probable endolytic peptidoglycan transglycosylase RlpA n=1 Tax=Flavobacterium algoritolerans TaxID=3041254 RepID=A0ABT6V811_9FLAO|nr:MULTISPECIES: septal ring lytic transglycosylase RlpA family protein [Flavobacterium]MDI5886929.1 septal ring lytic transglycosylase RlpA family protein [Flavobacterium yafengii]MDI5893960.1 septal ring lytic transglycosylase RlpA family protein [Flavobacterium algoritolerans]
MKKAITLFFLLAIISLVSSQSSISEKQKAATQKDTLKKGKAIIELQENKIDSLITSLGKFKIYKKEAHASYYADKFNGKRTTSGRKFDNNKYTAAHKKLPFGTKVKVTNEKNGKSVIVEITDRGPFVKSREIDLSKRAFMDIASNKSSGGMQVTIAVLSN